MSPAPRITSPAMRAKLWPLLEEAIEVGVAYGIARHNKYAPDEALVPEGAHEALTDHLVREVQNAIGARFDFDGDIV